MAYIVPNSIVSAVNEAVSTTQEVVLGEHQVDDYLVVAGQQDGGTVAITISAGWTEIPAGQAASGSSRQAIFYKKATSSNEANPTLTGRSETWNVVSMTIRDADLTTFIDIDSRTDWSSTGTPSSPSVTTSTDDCLLLYFLGADGRRKALPETLGDATYISKTAVLGGGGNLQVAGYSQAGVAGIQPAVTWQHEITIEGGNAFTVAVRNKAGGSRASMCSNSFSAVARFGLIESPVWSDASILIPSMNSINTFACTPNVVSTDTINDALWFDASGMTFNDAALDLFTGQVTTLPSVVDYTGKNASITFEVSNTDNGRFAAEGIIVSLLDSTGNWASWQASPRSKIQAGSAYTFHWTPDSTVSYDESATPPDFTDINRFAIWQHRANSSSNLTVAVRDLIIKDSITLTGGSISDPISPAVIENAAVGWQYHGQASNQGSGQGVSTLGIQIGDGSTESYTDFTATSYETRGLDTTNAQVDNTQSFILYPSANDTINLTSCVVKANTPNAFSYHASSSVSSSDDFTGASIIGWDLTNLTGKTINNANITDCTVTQNGGSFTGCSILNSPVTGTDLSLFTNNTFTSGGAGHAIELTSLGGGSMNWDNQLSGYATSDGSIGDEAIFVNVASGTLTINVADGSASPSIRTAGAVITKVVSPSTITITGIVDDTEVRIYRVSDGVEIMGTENSVGGSFSDTYNYTSDFDVDIVVHHVEYKYISFNNFTLDGTDATIPVTQVFDDTYSNP